MHSATIREKGVQFKEESKENADTIMEESELTSSENVLETIQPKIDRVRRPTTFLQPNLAYIPLPNFLDGPLRRTNTPDAPECNLLIDRDDLESA